MVMTKVPETTHVLHFVHFRQTIVASELPRWIPPHQFSIRGSFSIPFKDTKTAEDTFVLEDMMLANVLLSLVALAASASELRENGIVKRTLAETTKTTQGGVRLVKAVNIHARLHVIAYGHALSHVIANKLTTHLEFRVEHQSSLL